MTHYKSTTASLAESINSFKSKFGDGSNTIAEQLYLLENIKESIKSMGKDLQNHLDSEKSELDFSEFKKTLQSLYSLAYIECGDGINSVMSPNFPYLNVMDYFNKYAEESFKNYMYLDTFTARTTLQSGSSYRKIINIKSATESYKFPYPTDLEFLQLMGIHESTPLYQLYWANYMLLRLNKAPVVEVIEHALINRIISKRILNK